MFVPRAQKSAAQPELERVALSSHPSPFFTFASSTLQALRKIFNEKSWRIAIVCSPQRGQEFEPPYSAAELKGLGFEGYVVDCFNAPEPIKRYMCTQVCARNCACGLATAFQVTP